ncbi:MAG: hypothetical protein HRU75_14100 [Planctomycetia bacterium]|nr:MAG: hypothetical protein HRU75_14100 [Planctomycetia bacterium]
MRLATIVLALAIAAPCWAQGVAMRYLQQPTNTPAGQIITPAVRLEIVDINGQRVTNSSATVTIAILNGTPGASLLGTRVRDAVNGVVTFDNLSINLAGAVFNLRATSPGMSFANSDFFSVTQPPVAVAFSQQPSNIVAGTVMTPAVTVRFVDSGGATVTGANAPITLALFDNPTGAIPIGTLTRNAVNGVATFNDLSLVQAASGYTFRASSSGVTPATSIPFNVTAGIGQFTQFVGPPMDGTAGVTLAPVTAELTDQFGNRDLTSSAAVTISLADNPGAATLFGTLTRNAVNGLVIFNDLSIRTAANGYSFRATNGFSQQLSQRFNISPAAPAALAFGQQPTQVNLFENITPAVTVRVNDAFGNLTSSPSANVTMSIQTGPAGATLSGGTTRASTGGVATFDDLRLDRSGAYTLRAEAGGLTAALSASFNVIATPVAIEFVQQPTNAVAGASITPSVTVRLVDVLGNTVGGATNPVTIALIDNPVGATLGGTLTRSAVNGVATFNNLSVDRVHGSYRLRATSGALPTIDSAPFAVTPGVGTQLRFIQQPTNALVDAVIAPPVQLELLDAFGNRDTNNTSAVTLSIAINPGAGTLAGTTTRSAVAGVVSFDNLSISRPGNGYTLAASTATIAPTGSAFFNIIPRTPVALQFVQQPTTVVAGTTIAPAITVRVIDDTGVTVTTATAAITLSIGNNPGGSTLGGTLVRTPVNGVATFGNITLDRTGTGYTLRAAAAGLTDAISTAFNVTPAPATALRFAQQPLNSVAQDPISPPVQVELIDAFGNRDTNNTSAVTIAIQNNPAGGTLSGTTTRSAVAGLATFDNLSINNPGTGYTLRASTATLGPIISNAFDILPRTPVAVHFVQEPTSAVAGQTIAPPITVRIVDADGATIPTATLAVTLTLTTNPGGATLAGTVTRSAVNGIATFNDISLNRVGTGYRLTAASGALTPDTSAAFNITPAPASVAVFTQQPSNVTAGESIAPPITVELRDAFGNRDTNSSAAVTLAIQNNPGGATLSGTLTRNAAAGIATFNDLSLNVPADGYTLRAVAGPIGPVASAAFNVTPRTPTAIAFVQGPTDVVAGQAITPSITVRLIDAQGATTLGRTDAITLSLASNPGGSTLGGTLTRNAVNGVATFNNITLDRAATGYTLRATSGALPQITSGAFAVSAAAANALRFAVQPTSTESGRAIAPAVQVELIDPFGNRATGSAATITLALGSNPGAGTLSGTLARATTNGVAVFDDLSINNPAAGYTLAATAPSLTGAVSSAFTITPRQPTALAFVQQPTSATAGQAITPAITVRLIDDQGMTVTGATNSITLSFATDPTGGAAVLSGTVTRAAVNGVATFNDISINRAAAGFILRAASAGLTSANSTPFNISAAAATALRFAQQPTNTLAGGTITPPVTVEFIDGLGNRNLTANGLVNIAIQNNPGGGTLSGTTAVSAVNGLATFSGLSINAVGGGYTLRATSAGVSDALSAPFDITSGIPSAVRFNQQPTTAVYNQPISPPITVRIVDSGGSTVVGSATPITLELSTNPTNAVLSGTLTRIPVNGIATFDDIRLSRSGAGFRIRAVAGGLTAATSVPFNILSGEAVGLNFVAPPPNVGAGAQFSPSVAVEVVDAAGNRVINSNAFIIVAFGTNPTGAALGGQTSRIANEGVAVFDDLFIITPGNGYRFRAFAGIFPPADSAPFSVLPGAPASVEYLQQPSPVNAGEAISPPVRVRLRDSFNNIVTTPPTPVTLSLAGDPPGVTLGGQTTRDTVNGVAEFNDVFVTLPGEYQLLAATGQVTPLASIPFTVTGGAQTALRFLQQPTTTTAGSAITPPVTVEVIDQFGARVPTATNTVTIALTQNPTGATLAGTVTRSAVNGIATFNDIFLDRTGQGYRLGATSGLLTPATSNAFAISGGPAAGVRFVQQPSDIAPGAPITPAVTVELIDAFGNRATGATQSVTLTLATNPGGGSLTGTLTRDAVAGLATFDDVSVTALGSGYTLRATATAGQADSESFDVQGGVASALRFSVQPPSGAVGTPLAPAVVVEIVDEFGNRIPSPEFSITVQLADNPSGAVLGGTLTRTSAAGLATFGDLTLDRLGSGYTLLAANGGLLPATSAPFSITAGAPTQLRFVQQPAGGSAGATLPPVAVEVLDAFDNRVTSFTDAVTISLRQNPGAAALGGTLSRNAVAGVAAFDDLTIGVAAQGYTLVAEANGLTPAQSAPFNIGSGQAVGMRFLGVPPEVAIGAPQQLQVEIIDSLGNRVTNRADTVALGLVSNPGGAEICGVTLRNAVAGIATFPGLRLSRPGDGYQWRAISFTLPSADSATFDVIRVMGDMDCNGVFTNFDIDPFVLALTDSEAYGLAFPCCDILNGDIDGNGAFTNFDLDPFVELLTR